MADFIEHTAMLFLGLWVMLIPVEGITLSRLYNLRPIPGYTHEIPTYLSTAGIGALSQISSPPLKCVEPSLALRFPTLFLS